MTGNVTLPRCFAIGRPLAPNKCENCPVREDCRKYVPKEALKPIHAALLRVEERLRVG